MEAVLHNLECTVELLAVSQTDFVAEWDGDTVNRAFQWAQYCEHLHTRFHTNPSVCAALESRLCETNQLLAHTFTAYRCLTLSDLAQCRHRLLVGLLKNTATPHFVIKSLFDKFALAEDAQEGDPRVNLSDLSASRSACRLLGDFTLNRKSVSGLSAGTQARGSMLIQRIKAIQSHSGNQEYATKLMDCLLDDSGEGQGSFLTLTTAALLSTDTMDEDTAAAKDFLLDWIERRDGLLSSMCWLLPPELCTSLCQGCPKFRLVYWDSFKKSASSLMYDVSNGLWIQPCDTAVSFPTLAERLKSLWSSGSPLKDETEEQLVALKQADGDFQVEGLSVWTDLLVQLR